MRIFFDLENGGRVGLTQLGEARQHLHLTTGLDQDTVLSVRLTAEEARALGTMLYLFCPDGELEEGE